MGSEWREVRVEEIKSSAPSALATGPFGSAIGSRFFQDSGVPVLRGSNLSEDVGRRLVEDDLAFLSPEKASEFKRSIARRGDLVFTCWGTIGQVGLVDDRSRFHEYVVSNKQMKLTPDPATADSLFLYYLFSNPAMVAHVRNAGIGSSVPGFNLGQLRQIPILLPPLAEQRRIAGILGALDDKIELNRRMSQTLESMARTLFKSWFVDFDPVRAKSEGRDPGVPGHLADRLPDSLEDSETGQIPKGWRLCGLDEIADFLNGLALQRFPANDGRVLPAIKIAQLHAGNTEGADEVSVDIPSDYVVQDGDVLFSWSGSLSVELWCGGPGALNQHLFKVTSERYPKWFYYLWTREHLADFRAIAAGKATTMGHIQREHLAAARVVVPSLATLDETSQYFEPLTGALVSLSLESRSLAAARDSLLPRLLSVGFPTMSQSGAQPT